MGKDIYWGVIAVYEQAKGCSPLELGNTGTPRARAKATETGPLAEEARTPTRPCKRVRAEQKTQNKKMCTLRNLCANFSMTLKRCRRAD